MARRRWIVMCASVAALVASGACGGGDTGPKPLDKQAYIERADRLCDAANKKLDALPEPTSLEEAANSIRIGVATTRTLLADIRKAEPPAADKATVEGIYRMIEQALVKLQDAMTAARAGDAATMETLINAGNALVEQSNTTSATYGFDECSK